MHRALLHVWQRVVDAVAIAVRGDPKDRSDSAVVVVAVVGGRSRRSSSDETCADASINRAVGIRLHNKVDRCRGYVAVLLEAAGLPYWGANGCPHLCYDSGRTATAHRAAHFELNDSRYNCLLLGRG